MTKTLFDLTGKTALVTGCSKGIGFAMAEGLAEAGADIIGISSSLNADGGAIGEAIRNLDRKFVSRPLDLSDLKKITPMIDELIQEHGVPDILINNAGIIRRAPAAEHPDQDWFDVIDINLNAPFLLAREVGRHMVKRGSGKIIFTASLLTFQGGITVPGYAASKGAIGQVTKALANEWARHGVNVNAIAPGYIATDNTEALRNDPVRSEQILARIPAGRWGKPEDFKGPTVFLASDAANYVSGEVLVVDGGWMGR